MVLIMGVVFQMPAIVAFLTWLRILNASVLKRVWRIALVVIFIAAAVITPTGDPYTQTLVAIPLVILYFISMGIAALIGREPEESGRGRRRWRMGMTTAKRWRRRWRRRGAARAEYRRSGYPDASPRGVHTDHTDRRATDRPGLLARRRRRIHLRL